MFERRALIAAKNSSLLILAFFVQFGVFILEGIWFAVDIPPPEVHNFIVLVPDEGYSRSASCALNLISTFLLNRPLRIKEDQL
jgi:hypothetical protein